MFAPLFRPHIPDHSTLPILPEEAVRDLETALTYAEGTAALHAMPLSETTVDGITVRYRGAPDHDSPPVFVHGWCGSSAVWSHQVLRYGSEALYIDLPGHGESDAPPREYPVALLARAVTAVMEDAGVSRPRLVGHSMGAWVALCTAASSPDVAGVVVVDQTLRPPPADSAVVAAMLAPLHGAGQEAFMGELFAALLGSGVMPRAREDVLSTMRQTAPHVRLSAFADALSLTINGEWPPFPPLAAIYGRSSPVADPSNPLGIGSGYEAFVRQTAPGATVHWIDRAAHFVMLDRPNEFAEALDRSLETLGKAGRPAPRNPIEPAAVEEGRRNGHST